jgi:predicted RNA polymerase sigma factor
LLAAASHWTTDGIPPNPRGWLMRTARLRMIDQYRSDAARRDRERAATLAEAAAADDLVSDSTDRDDSLALLLMCCHPSLTPASAIALTLRAFGGLTTAEVAAAFLVPDATMGQRISRAKSTIRASGVPFALPAPDDLPARVTQVLRVIYLLYNEAHTSTGASLTRVDLAVEAIRLARLTAVLLPDDAEVAGLLALLLLLDARRPARTTGGGDLVPLAEQDRSRWDREQIAEGTDLLDAAIGRGRVGEYQLQAAIAAIHDRAPSASETDWPQILALYELLERMTGSPVVTLNRAVAAAMVHGPTEGLQVMEGTVRRLGDHHRYHAVRAWLLEQDGDLDGAIESYRLAATRTTSLAEQRYLVMQGARLRAAR